MIMSESRALAGEYDRQVRLARCNQPALQGHRSRHRNDLLLSCSVPLPLVHYCRRDNRGIRFTRAIEERANPDSGIDSS
jgi:hypothetical protein